MVTRVNNNKSSGSRKIEAKGAWFVFVLLFLLVEYGRPQDVLPIGFIRPGMIVSLGLMYFILTTPNFLKASDSSQTRLIWYFILLTSVYIPFATNNYWAYDTTKSMLMMMPFILSVVLCVNSIDRLKALMNILMALLIYVSIYGLLNAGMGSGNYFADENDLSLFLNMLIPFAYFLFIQEKGFHKKIFYASALLAGLAGVVVSFSRGGLVGLVCVGFVIWLSSSRKMLTIFLLMILGVGLYLYSGEEYLAEMKTISNTSEGTANARLLSWKAGWAMFLDNPLGVGGNNFPVHFHDYQPDGFSKSMWGRVAHSLWFTLIPELGIIGIFLYFSLLQSNLKDILFMRNVDANNNKDVMYIKALAAAMLAAFAGYFASGTFLSVLYYPHYWYLTGMIVAMMRITEHLRLRGEMNPNFRAVA